MTNNNLSLTSSRIWSNRDEDWDQNQRRQLTRSRPINNQQGERGGMYLPWRQFEERVRTGPFGLVRFPSHPHSPAQILIIEGTINGERVNPRLLQFIHDSPPRIQGEWQLGFIPEPESSGLTDAEFNSAMKKLRKQTYDPPQLKRKAWKRGLFSSSNHVEGSNDEKNEDKKCTICLEPFVPKKQVLVTPCNHMFHNKCLTPWVKSHGQCPVCRYKLCERKEIIQTPNYNYNSNSAGNIYEDDLALDLITLVRAMEEALMWMRLS
ncbi:hypothetical protein M5K25_023943 [Dendrobium thyrsiflorum]|uniref:RING-type domain-containing protein n=1 Tax=Dendrobium thyrsiflorum TaxID=117978 RepID=A0ABD0U0U4_DENTH